MLETALRLVYDDSPYLSFVELLTKKNRQGFIKEIQFPATEVFKVKNGVSTGLIEDIFQFANEPHLYEIIIYCLEREVRQFFTEQKTFLLWLQKFRN